MTVIDDYFKHVTEAQRVELQRLRSIALETIPDAEEAIYYAMPTIKYKGRPIIGFDAHKNHIGIYPYSGKVISKIKELENYPQTKGALRESLDNLVPPALIRQIIELRMKNE